MNEAPNGERAQLSLRLKLRLFHHYITQVTGQTFGFSVLDKVEFNYDTEPACRAVVAMGHLLEKRGDSSQVILAFFSAIQKQFYVDGADPKQPEFYRGLCAQFGVAYEDFLQMFSSA